MISSVRLVIAKLAITIYGSFSESETLDCFPPEAGVDYYDCCREMQPTGRTPMHNQCFDDEFTFESCCTFQFGPVIRGLPYSCTTEEDGIARLWIGKGGPLGFHCRNPGREEERTLIWLHGYLVGAMLADFPRVIDVGREAWELGSAVLDPLVGRPLRILDAGCGIGIASIAAARLGHNVTAADIDPLILSTARRNVRQNRVRVFTQVWDMLKTPPESMLARGPFDLAYVEIGAIITGTYNANKNQDLADIEFICSKVISNLLDLGVQTFLFLGNYNALRNGGFGMDTGSAALMYYLAAVGKRSGHMKPCSGSGTALCARLPYMSPKGWIAQVGLAPPSTHFFILW